MFLNYRQIDRDQTDEIEDLDTAAPNDIREVNNDATERRYNGGFSLELATQSRSSYQLDFAATRFDYSGGDGDTSDNTPRTTLEGDAMWLLALNPVLTGDAGGRLLRLRRREQPGDPDPAGRGDGGRDLRPPARSSS